MHHPRTPKSTRKVHTRVVYLYPPSVCNICFRAREDHHIHHPDKLKNTTALYIYTNQGSVCVCFSQLSRDDLTVSSGNNKKLSRAHTPGLHIYIPPLCPSGIVVVRPFNAAAVAEKAGGRRSGWGGWGEVPSLASHHPFLPSLHSPPGYRT